MSNQRWDKYFYGASDQAQDQSRCLSRKIGAVIVKDDKFVVSTGYNGPPMGFPNPGTDAWFNVVSKVLGQGPNSGGSGITKFTDKDARELLLTGANFWSKCPRQILGYESGEKSNFCPCAHAERSSIDIAARLGHPVEGCKMYLSCPIPCRDCAFSIVNSGIVEVIVTSMAEYEKEGFTGGVILRNCGVKLRVYE